ncbi:SCAN box domain-containing protein [Trichonephila clavipes]|nr:SCAN box domain-containing protein [Trichonephila clavipes]
MAREVRQHELELRKLELSQQNQPLNDESGRRFEIEPKIQLTQITTKFDEKHNEISLYLINFERKAELAQVPKKDWVAYLLAVLTAELSNMLAREPTERANNYDFVKDLILKSGARPKETPKDFKSKFQIKKELVHEKNHEKDFEKRRQLRCYECGSYSHLRPQCDKLKKNYETVVSNETVRSGTDVLAPYTSLGTVNGIEMPILRDTGATLDLICKSYIRPSMFINETVWIRTPLEETAVCLPMAEVELECVFGHVITKAAVLRDSLDQGKYLLGNKTAALFEEVNKNKEIQVYMVNAVETRLQKKLTEESKQDLNMSEEIIPESNEKNKESPDELDDILPLIQPEISESNLIKLSHKDFTKEQMKSAELKTLFEEDKAVLQGKIVILSKITYYFSKKKISMALNENVWLFPKSIEKI